MILATPTAVLKRLGLATSEDRLDTITSALQGVTYRIEADLRTPLALTDRVDYFSVPIYRVHPRQIQLNLTQGFVDTGTAVVITVSSAGFVADSTDTITLEDEDFEIDYESGIITMHKYIYSGTETISVTYTSGFAVSGQKLAIGSPAWLEEAAKAATVLILNAENFTRQKTRAPKHATNAVSREYTSIINNHIRPRSSGLSPWRGVTV